MNYFIELAFSGFWQFVGAYFMLYLVVELLLRGWVRLTRMLMVRKHGWPPAHLDADGDFKTND